MKLKTKKLLISIIVTFIVLIVSIIGTYAFYTATASNNNVVNATAATADLELTVTKKAGGEFLVPQLTDYLQSALTGTDNVSCIDGNGNTVCQVYEATIKNTGTAATVLDGTINISAATYVNLKWEELKDVKTRKDNPVSNLSAITYLVEDLKLEVNESKTYYIAIWIAETSSRQNDTDNGTFTGTISFNGANGKGVTSTFLETCLAKGTKITMADGTTKNIEDIKVGDSIMTFDHNTGTLKPELVYLAFKGENTGTAFTLHFSNNEELSIVGIHDLFMKEQMKYVRITESNAEKFIGYHFYNALTNEFVELKSIRKDIKNTEYYSLYTEFNQNSIANNMLTIPDDVDYYLNVFEFNDNLTINKKRLEQDIKKYGLYYSPNYDSFSDSEKYNSQYINIIIGKGLATMSKLEELKKYYDEHK